MAIIGRLKTLSGALLYRSKSSDDVDLVMKDDDQVLALKIKSNAADDWRGLKAFRREFPADRIATIDYSARVRLLTAKDIAPIFEALMKQAV